MTSARRRLGASDLEISPLGLGTWAIGGPWLFGWGEQEDADSIAAIRRAVASGINWIDTAPAYGLGHAETVARALAGLPGVTLPVAGFGSSDCACPAHLFALPEGMLRAAWRALGQPDEIRYT